MPVCVVRHHIDLVSRMKINEKISQLGNDAGPIPRLTVPAYQW